MEPYYDQDGITIYNADCRLILPTLKADLLLTDPPYGIQAARNKSFGRGRKRTLTGFLAGQAPIQCRDYGDAAWDDAPPSPWLFGLMREITRYQIIFGGNYFPLPPSRCWLVWDKVNGATHYADAELAWTNLDKAVRMVKHRWNGFLQEKGHKEKRYHPTQKPTRVMEWCISQAPDDCRTILDPFMGVGTTLLAAKRLGRHAIGIEQNEHYCAIAVQRLAAISEIVPLSGVLTIDNYPTEGVEHANHLR